MRLKFSSLFFLLSFCVLPPSSSRASGFLHCLATSIMILSNSWSPAEGEYDFLRTARFSEPSSSEVIESTRNGSGYHVFGKIGADKRFCATHFEDGTLDLFKVLRYSGRNLHVYGSAMTVDGSIFLAGSNLGSGGGMYAALMSAGCDPVWAVEFTGTSSPRFSSVGVLSDLSAVFIGKRSSNGFIVKMLPSGVKVWDREVSFPNSVDRVVGAVSTGDELYIAGTMGAGGFTLAKMTEAGGVEYCRMYSFPSSLSVNVLDIATTDDGYIVITGFLSASSMWHFFYGKLDVSNGEILYFYRGDSNGFGFSIVVTEKGGIAIAGFYGSAFPIQLPLIVEADGDGRLEAAYVLNTTSYSATFNTAYDLVQDPDGAFVLVGSSQDFTTWSDYEAFIARVGSDEAFACGSNVTLNLVNFTQLITSSSFNATVSNASAPYIALNHTVLSITPNVSDVCYFTPSPSIDPTLEPTLYPSQGPSGMPSRSPSLSPTQSPSLHPTDTPSKGPTQTPSQDPTHAPTLYPSQAPTHMPSYFPSLAPSSPTDAPSVDPSETPTHIPTIGPSRLPTSAPSASPSSSPSLSPTQQPTINPSSSPSLANSKPIVVGRIDNQEATVGSFYLSTLQVGAVFYDEEENLLTYAITASSLQGQSVDWLRIHTHNHTLSGTPKGVDRILILVNATDPKGATAGSSFELEVKEAPSSSSDPLNPGETAGIIIGATIAGFVVACCIYWLLIPICVGSLGARCFFCKKRKPKSLEGKSSSPDFTQQEMNQMLKGLDVNDTRDPFISARRNEDTIFV